MQTHTPHLSAFPPLAQCPHLSYDHGLQEDGRVVIGVLYRYDDAREVCILLLAAVPTAHGQLVDTGHLPVWT